MVEITSGGKARLGMTIDSEEGWGLEHSFFGNQYSNLKNSEDN